MLIGIHGGISTLNHPNHTGKKQYLSLFKICFRLFRHFSKAQISWSNSLTSIQSLEIYSITSSVYLILIYDLQCNVFFELFHKNTSQNFLVFKQFDSSGRKEIKINQPLKATQSVSLNPKINKAIAYSLPPVIFTDSTLEIT